MMLMVLEDQFDYFSRKGRTACPSSKIVYKTLCEKMPEGNVAV